ncbi:MAG: hypothetical protein LBT49_03295 [Prevotellaceae bacterium]|jgi:uncharacterized protein (TIGR02145 family)|nr:hypothetical protein [Prevotellaceae bacterium]
MKKTTKIVMAGLLIFSGAVCVAQTAAVTPDITVAINTSYTITSAATATGATAYRWLENGATVTNGSNVSYTNSAGKPNNSSYIYIRQAWIDNCWQNSNAIIVQVGTGGTIDGDTGDGGCGTIDGTFAAFTPSSTAAVGTVWCLTDTRESGNKQTYKVKKMADGHIWMVQDLKFGTCPNSNDNWVNESSETATTQGTTVAPGYIGHCRASSQAGAGYLYTWAAAMQNSLAYNGTSITTFACAGVSSGTGTQYPSACRGLCPVGWHLPTGASSGEYQNLNNALGSCPNTNDECWNASSPWEGAYSGYCNMNAKLQSVGQSGWYHTSTYNDASFALGHYYNSTSYEPGSRTSYIGYGLTVRCVMNY